MEEMSPSKPSDVACVLPPDTEDALDWVNVWVFVVDAVE